MISRIFFLSEPRFLFAGWAILYHIHSFISPFFNSEVCFAIAGAIALPVREASDDCTAISNREMPF
jgi:hypothetical protein